MCKTYVTYNDKARASAGVLPVNWELGELSDAATGKKTAN